MKVQDESRGGGITEQKTQGVPVITSPAITSPACSIHQKVVKCQVALIIEAFCNGSAVCLACL